MRRGPFEQRVGGHGVDDPVGSHTALSGAVGAVGLPFELGDRVGVGADRDAQPGRDRFGEDPFGRVEPFGPAIDFERSIELLDTLR